MNALISSTLRHVATQLGFDIRRIKKISNGYEQVFPFATYSPWNMDESFKEIFSRIRSSTLVDRYRCFELWRLVEQTAKLSSGGLIEIGVWRGGTGALIAKQAENCGIGPVFLCDTFAGVVKAGDRDSAYRGGEHADTARSIVENLIFEQLNLDNVTILEGVFPEQTGDLVQDQRFRFCHIDVDVYQSAKDIVNWIWGRMVPGGILVYDDYGFDGCDGIAKHVEEQMSAQDRLVIHNLNGHAIILKLGA